jgi:type II secretory pathway predicted ATPase ExeA
MYPKMQTLYGLKFNPFRPDVPSEALYLTPAVDAFIRRSQSCIDEGGFLLITGEPGTGKSVVLRLLAERLSRRPEVLVSMLEHPQSHTTDFYRELGDAFGVKLCSNNRWGSFKALRSRWSEHITATLQRPVLIIDEAQESLTQVLCELRILASKEFDSRQLLCVIFAGDQRLPDRLRAAELLPLASRIRRRLVLEYAVRARTHRCIERFVAMLEGEHVESLPAAGSEQGRKDEALAELQKAVAAGFKERWTLQNEPDLAAVRADPRFQALLARS